MKGVVMGLGAMTMIFMASVGVANAEKAEKELVCSGVVGYQETLVHVISFNTPEIKVKKIKDLEKAVEQACDPKLEMIGLPGRRFTQNYRMDLKCTIGDLSFNYFLNKDKF